MDGCIITSLVALSQADKIRSDLREGKLQIENERKSRTKINSEYDDLSNVMSEWSIFLVDKCLKKIELSHNYYYYLVSSDILNTSINFSL